MGMNPRGRMRGRNHNNFNNNNNNNNNGNRRFGGAPSRNTVYDSIGPAGRLRGTAYQLMEKYLAAAKDFMTSDRVVAENCLQHADHYMRLNALAVSAEQRNNPQYQPQPAVDPAAADQPEIIEESSVQAENSAPAEQDEPEIERIPASAPAPVQTAPKAPDLSVPVSVMAENEKKRLQIAPEPKAANTAAPVARRRGRPPRVKPEAIA